MDFTHHYKDIKGVKLVVSFVGNSIIKYISLEDITHGVKDILHVPRRIFAKP